MQVSALFKVFGVNFHCLQASLGCFQLSAVVLAGIFPDGISESCIFSEIWIFVFENLENVFFFILLKNFLFAPILPGR